MARVRYVGGLNDYEYDASLHITGSTISARELSARFRREPTRSHERGDARRTSGVYESAYWSVDLVAKAGESYDEFLASFCTEFEEFRELLKEIRQSGGCMELFMGLFATRCCDASISHEELLRLGQLGIDLRLDFYGPHRDSTSCEVDGA
jgi:hypothetical protein